MKKKIRIFAILLIAMIFTATLSSAATTFNVKLKTDSTTISKDQTSVVLYLNLQDYSSDGILGYEATLNYDKNIFENVMIDGLNSWDTPSYDSTTNKFVSTTENAKSNTNIARIELKIKSGVTAQTTTISINNLIVSDGIDATTLNFEVKYTFEANQTNKNTSGGTSNTNSNSSTSGTTTNANNNGSTSGTTTNTTSNGSTSGTTTNTNNNGSNAGTTTNTNNNGSASGNTTNATSNNNTGNSSAETNNGNSNSNSSENTNKNTTTQVNNTVSNTVANTSTNQQTKTNKEVINISANSTSRNQADSTTATKTIPQTGEGAAFILIGIIAIIALICYIRYRSIQIK